MIVTTIVEYSALHLASLFGVVIIANGGAEQSIQKLTSLS